MALIQEPYTINYNVAGIPRSFKTFAFGNGRKRTVIIVNNNELDVLLVNQLLDENCVVTEIRSKLVKFYCASIYFDINEDIETSIRKIERIINHTNGTALIIAAGTNAKKQTMV